MSAIRYPVATDAETALTAPAGHAEREREAATLAGGRAVSFVTEPVGETYATLEAAMDGCAGRIDDDRPDRRRTVPPEDRYCQLREVVEASGGRQPVVAPVEPVFEDGRRWPKAERKALATRWRLSVSYWRIEPADQARRLRRRPEAAALSAREVQALARQPLRPVRPQQPLDIGLFEHPAPEAPHILIPDE